MIAKIGERIIAALSIMVIDTGYRAGFSEAGGEPFGERALRLSASTEKR